MMEQNPKQASIDFAENLKQLLPERFGYEPLPTVKFLHLVRFEIDNHINHLIGGIINAQDR